jgi:hypothetical protein
VTSRATTPPHGIAAGAGWLVAAASSAGAALALVYALWLTGGSGPERAIKTPEQAAVEFIRAYQARDLAAAAKLARGDLRRSLETRARSARLQGRPELARAGQLVIEESVMLSADRLRFRGLLAEQDTPDASGWPVSVTVARDGASYLAEALQWPQGPPPDER